MKSAERISILVAIIFISLGVLFLALSLIPGITLSKFWPLLFFVLAAGFYLPPILWPPARRELAALHIPGSVMLMMGIIFQYNTLTSDWAIWAYAWLLLSAGVGMGLSLAAWLGEWGPRTIWVGIWLMVACFALFSLFAVIFGGTIFKIVGPIMLILGGVVLLVRAIRKPGKSKTVSSFTD